MWEQAMSTSKAKRSWSRLSRSSFTQAPTSPAWDSGSAGQPQASNAPAQQKDASVSSDLALLQSLRKLLSDFDQLCVLNGTPLTDQRVVSIRKDIEKAMPRLYALTDGQSSNQTTTEARKVKNFAENFLRKFPEVNIDALRSSNGPDTVSRKAPSPQRPTEVSIPSISSGLTLPSTRAFITASKTGSMPTEYDSRQVPMHLQKAIEIITPAQKMVLLAVHDLLSTTTAATQKRDSLWFDPPAAKSPEELQKVRVSSCDMRTFIPNTQHFQRVPHALPPQLPTSQNVHRYPQVAPSDHPQGVARPVARSAARSHRRSTSNDSML